MTPRQSPSDAGSAASRRDRALLNLEAYGAERSRWPAEAVQLFDEFAGDARFEAARRAAAALDETLRLAPAPAAGAALQERILETYAMRPAGGVFAHIQERSRRGFGRLIPASALAGLLALGFATGAATAGVGAESDAIYYAQATLTVAGDEEGALWAID
jgi:hypothetical protein